MTNINSYTSGTKVPTLGSYYTSVPKHIGVCACPVHYITKYICCITFFNNSNNTYNSNGKHLLSKKKNK